MIAPLLIYCGAFFVGTGIGQCWFMLTTWSKVGEKLFEASS